MGISARKLRKPNDLTDRAAKHVDCWESPFISLPEQPRHEVLNQPRQVDDEPVAVSPSALDWLADVHGLLVPRVVDEGEPLVGRPYRGAFLSGVGEGDDVVDVHFAGAAVDESDGSGGVRVTLQVTRSTRAAT